MPRGRPRKDEGNGAAAQPTKSSKVNGNGANLGFEAQLFLAADKLRKNLEPSDYKHVALGLIFLKHISNAFESKRAALLAEDPAAAEDSDEYLAENVFWVPKEARWSHLQANAKQPTIGKLIDDAMAAIEAHNPGLKGVLPKDYNRPALDKVMVGELIDLISGIAMGEPGDKAKDLLGRVYEYFLGGFAGSEGKRGGEFYTPRSVVRVLVEMLEPYKGRIYDPCCGSGGMFVQSEKFVETHGGRIGDIAIYGQESNYTTWRLAKMNLAVRGIDADIRWNNEGSFHKDELKDLRFDYILANPPFNISDWGGERLREDTRWTDGVARNKNPGGKMRDRRSEVLFIDARKVGTLVDRTHKEFSEDDIARIAGTYHAWREGTSYEDVPGFCKAAKLDEIRGHNYVLTPGRYVGAADLDDDDVPFPERFAALRAKLDGQFAEAATLTATIRSRLAGVES